MLSMARRENIRKKANNIRKKYELRGAIDFKKIFNSENIKLLSANLTNLIEGKDISGILRIDEEKKEIIINKNHIDMRTNFTIGHELGHYFLHQDYVKKHNGKIISFRGNGYSILEEEADLFSAELLMPRHELYAQAQLYKDGSVETLAKHFKVSKVAMLKRIKELNYEEDKAW